jgi:hypothetical protein
MSSSEFQPRLKGDGCVRKEVSCDTKVDSSEVRRQYGQKKVILLFENGFDIQGS